jgi:hypothetical protein
MILVPVMLDAFHLRSSMNREIKWTAVTGRTFQYSLRSSMIAEVKRAAVTGRTFQ